MTQATRNDTAVLETIREVVDGAAAGKVFGEPITQQDITIVPVAKVSGGGGGGGGAGPAEQGREARGAGGGMGLSARALGVFVIKDGKVAWRPAVDVNRVILGGQIVIIAALLLARAIVKARKRW
jgi:uncharacterized spore protein YtfJ